MVNLWFTLKWAYEWKPTQNLYEYIWTKPMLPNPKVHCRLDALFTCSAYLIWLIGGVTDSEFGQINTDWIFLYRGRTSVIKVQQQDYKSRYQCSSTDGCQFVSPALWSMVFQQLLHGIPWYFILSIDFKNVWPFIWLASLGQNFTNPLTLIQSLQANKLHKGRRNKLKSTLIQPWRALRSHPSPICTIVIQKDKELMSPTIMDIQ